MEGDRKLAQAWEGFVSGKLATPPVRPVVRGSWTRCLAQVDVERRRAPALGDGELATARRRFDVRDDVVVPMLEEADRFLRETGSIMLITDVSGLVLYSQGDAATTEMAADNNLQPGGRWREADIGTNAIGTALVEQAPVQIHAEEHFCSDIKRWTCAAAPILHPLDGSLIGVLDISGPTSSFHPRALAHAVAAAGRVQSALGERLSEEHNALLCRCLASPRHLSGDLGIIDRDGRLVYASERVARLIDPQSPPQPGARIAELGEVAPEDWARHLPPAVADALVQPIERDGKAIGALVRLKGRGSPRPVRYRAGDTPPDLADIVGESAALRRAVERARRFAVGDTPVLIEGETGVGKELFARAIHAIGHPTGPFVPINAAALPRELVASELFGHEGGAFTGASEKGRRGKFEEADGGTLCLDEIGEMPLDVQPSLLRVLEDGVVHRLGGSRGVKVHARLVSMTNRDLRDEVARGAFRSDLFYRLSVARLHVPPLRERGDDVALLAEEFVRRACRRRDEPIVHIAPEVLDVLCGYDWPGNVRELRNVIETMLLLREDDRLTLDDVPDELRARVDAGGAAPPVGDLRRSERDAVCDALGAADGNISVAARRLGVARSTLYRKIKTYGLAGHVRR